MAAWDEVIWEEESVVAGAELELADEPQEASAGWLAGLAALTPRLLRRRRKDQT